MHVTQRSLLHYESTGAGAPVRLVVPDPSTAYPGREVLVISSHHRVSPDMEVKLFMLEPVVLLPE